MEYYYHDYNMESSVAGFPKIFQKQCLHACKPTKYESM